MMLFDTNPSENIVIVPPKPDFAFLTQDEFSYSNLYSYDGGSDAAIYGDGASPSANDAVPAAAKTASASSVTTMSSSSNTDRSSFDSSVFDNAAAAAAAAKENNATLRNPRNGAFTFQVHAEYDLLLHVQKDLDKYRNSSRDNSNPTDIQLSNTITKSVDEYCLQKQWMYHIGNEKSVAIGRFLRSNAEQFHQRNSNSGEVKKFICVDLGTYCGYSALVLAITLRQFIQDLSSSEEQHEQQPFEFHIYTTEVKSKLLNVAQSVFRLAKMDQYITPILMKESSDNDNTKNNTSMLSQTLIEQHGVTHIDFLLLDHAKHLYLEDLQDLENAKLLRAGSHVSADNVVFNQLDAYREYMHKLKREGVVESHLEEMNLEYSNNLKDGIEMSVYLKNPPTKQI